MKKYFIAAMVLTTSTVTVAAKKVKLTPSELDLTTQGGSKELECECDGLCSQVRWHKDGQQLRMENKLSIIGDKLIFFSNDDPNLVGEYKCEVDGTFSDASNVRFSSFDWIKIIKSNDRSVAGESLMIECKSQSFPTAEITWYKNGDEIRPDDHRIAISQSKGNSRLTFDEIFESDAGEYVCSGSTESAKTFAPQKSSPFELYVAPSYWLQKPPSMLSEKIGNNLKIECQPRALTEHIFWTGGILSETKLGKMERFEKDSRVSVDSDGSLIIDDIQTNDEGIFTCKTAQKEAQIEVKVIDDSDNTMTVIHPKESDSLLLECPLGGDDSVSWKPPQPAVELIEINLNEKEIKLESVVVEHEGEWSCKMGDRQYYFSIKVQRARGDRPDGPTVNQTGTQIRVTWENYSNEQKYTIIQAKRTSGILWSYIHTTVSSEEHEYELSNDQLLDSLPEGASTADVIFRIALTDSKKSTSIFSSPSNTIQVTDFNSLVLMIGIGAIVFIFLFIMMVVLCMRRYSQNHTKDAKKEFKYDPRHFHHTATYSQHYHAEPGHNTRQILAFRNGSDSGHGTKSSSSSRQDCDLPPLAYYTQTESPIIYHNSGSHLNPKDTLLSRKSSNNSVLFATSIQNPTLAHVPPSVQSNEHFHRNGIGEYAQIDIMPIDRTFQYTANRSEPIYESIEVANGNR